MRGEYNKTTGTHAATSTANMSMTTEKSKRSRRVIKAAGGTSSPAQARSKTRSDGVFFDPAYAVTTQRSNYVYQNGPESYWVELAELCL